MKKLLLSLTLILVACEATPPPRSSNDSMVDKRWETDKTWYDICLREKPAMCYGATYHSKDKPKDK